MIKKYKWLIIILAIIFSLLIISFAFSDNKDKCLKDITLSDAISKIENKDSFILYIKQTNCEHCKAFTPNLIDVLYNNNIEAYSLNLSDFDENDMEIFKDSFGDLGTPVVLFFNEGNQSLINIKGEQTKERIKSKIDAAGFIN